MNDAYESNWYTIGAMADILGVSTRTTRDVVRKVPLSLVREQPQAVGRPIKLYHYTAHPRLEAWHNMRHQAPADLTAAENADPIAADDMLRAELRLEAVSEYIANRRRLPEKAAAEAVVAEWKRRPRTRTYALDERLDGGHKRKRREEISIEFSVSTLRGWHSIYRKAARDPFGRVVPALALPALAPKRKGATGRKHTREQIERLDELIEFVYSLEAWSVRGDAAAAVAIARDRWDEEFPSVSLRTWERWLVEHDPMRTARSLNHGIAAFRRDQLPDIETDWNALAYNARWEPDDVSKDYYIIASDLERMVRPFAYAIIRSSTRQMVSVLTSETPIVKEQFRTQLGFSMCSEAGGIPDEIKFEHGAIACDEQLQYKLELCGIRVSRNEMDSGRKHSQAAPDRGRGNPRGHVLIERTHQRTHRMAAYLPGQVGTEERHTAPANLENAKKLVLEKRKRGEIVAWPDVNRYHELERQFMEAHNNTPHQGLPKTVDPETGELRHMTPNERAQQFQDVPVRVLAPECVAVFGFIGERVPVTRNGIRINNQTYGRFDADLRRFKEVTVTADPKDTRFVLIHELGRMVERYYKRRPGVADDQFAKRARIEKRLKNQYQQTVDRMLGMLGEGEILPIDRIHIAANPTPQRPTELVQPDELRQMANNMRRALEMARDRETAFDRSFSADLNTPPQPNADASEPVTSPRGGLLARREKLSAMAHVYAGGAPAEHEEDDQW